jgi:hypothetical protein
MTENPKIAQILVADVVLDVRGDAMAGTSDLSVYTLSRLAGLLLAILSLAARAAAAPNIMATIRVAAASRRSTRSHRGMSTNWSRPGPTIQAISRAGPQTC